MSSIAANVISIYKADITDAKAKINELKRTQTEAAKAEAGALAERNKGIEETIAKYGKLALGAAAAFAAIKTGMELWKEAIAGAEEDQRLERLSLSMDQLKEASLGLRTEGELHAFVLKSQSGVYKLNAEQIQTVVKAMSVYIQDGRDATEVYNAFGEAIQTGSTKALKAFGIETEGARNSTEALKSMMEQLTPVAAQSATATARAGDDMRRAGVELTDAIDRMKESLGKMVVALEPAITAITKLVTMIVDGWSMIADIARKSVQSIDGNLFGSAQAIIAMRTGNDVDESYRMWRSGVGGIVSTIELGKGMAKKVLDEYGSIELDVIDLSKAKLPKGRGPIQDMIEIEDVNAIAEKTAAKLAAARERMTAEMIAQSTASADAAQSFFDVDTLRTSIDAADASRTLLADYAAFNAQQTDSILKQMFGEPEEINMYAAGLATLQSAAVSAYQAIVTGSESMGQAVKKAIASSLLALGSEMLARSIYHAAAAIGSLAFGDFRGASTHGASAAKYAAGAVAVGVIAKSIGAGNGGTAGAATGTTTTAPSSTIGANLTPIAGGAGFVGRNITIVTGDDFADDSPRKRQQRAQRLVELGLRSTREVIFA